MPPNELFIMAGKTMLQETKKQINLLASKEDKIALKAANFILDNVPFKENHATKRATTPLTKAL